MQMKILKHFGIVIASVLIVLGIPFWCAGGLHSLFSSDPDAVSSASVILDKPSGEYYIFINKLLHTDTEALKEWITFFSGGEILYIFEDISCSVASGDAGGRQLAESFRSQLPENQMRIKPEDATLIASRADHGLYDIIVMSREYADITGILETRPDSMEVISYSQKEQPGQEELPEQEEVRGQEEVPEQEEQPEQPDSDKTLTLRKEVPAI